MASHARFYTTEADALGTEDLIYVLRASDLLLYESGIKAQGIAGNQGAEFDGHPANLFVPGIHRRPFPAGRRDCHRPDALPHGDSSSGVIVRG
ncbi:hypothetical protein GCM10023161_48330 [Mycobacterium paraffinicum]|uniref:Uncharacterized protein n=1 Tax=Mycobacterium paraffinicum TaxID=53378 RepID=A0ABP8F7E9_9MYCO